MQSALDEVVDPTSTGAARTTAIHLAVIPNPVMDPQRPYLLEIYPRRYGDTLVYFERNHGGKPPSKCKPREVLWLAYDIPQGYCIRITPKPGSTTALSAPADLTPVHDSEKTRPTDGPGPVDLDLRWAYKAELIDSQGNVSDTVDPEVIIKNDP